MKVVIDLDPKDVWRISEKAERLGMSNSEVLRDELAYKRRTAPPAARIRDLWGDGLCDADIAAELGYTNGRVGEIRRRMRLKPNKRYPSAGAA